MTTETSPVEPPEGLGARGRRFWEAAAEGYDLALDEQELLVEIARELDLVEALAEAIGRDGVMSVGSTGQPVAHPAVPQLHAARQLLGRLLSQLGLPGVDDEPTVLSPASASARKAAQVRWALQRERENRPLGRGHRGA